MVWMDAGLEAPIIEEMFGGGNPDRTVLTLPLGIVNPPIRQSAVSVDLKERHQQILSIRNVGEKL